MFRKIALFLTLVLAIGALFGCAAPGRLVEGTLTDEKKADMNRAYVAYHHGIRLEEEYDAYYGNYEGYDFFLITKKNIKGKDGISVEGVIFQHPYHSFDIYGYRDGTFYLAADLCWKGNISIETVETLAQINRGEKAAPTIKKALKAEAEGNWLTPYLADEKYHMNWLSDSHFLKDKQYYGSVEGYDVLLHYPVGGAAVISGPKVGEYSFLYGMSGIGVYAFKDGTMYSLTKLYEEGKISEKSVEVLWEKHKEWFPGFYD